MTDTIAAISTAFGEAAISLLRVSGPDTRRIVQAIFRPAQKGDIWQPRLQQYGRVVDSDERTLDSVLLTVFAAPASYTGEDVAEISCHGGILITRRLFERLLEAGARAAGPGEFTQRAFLHGKMDLTQAEAVMDLIHAQSDLALQAATSQLSGRLGATADEVRGEMLSLLAHVEAYIDFPDEDIDPDTGAALLKRVEGLDAQLQRLLDTAEHGRILRQGARTVICGEPNAGKSSLLNLLSGFERAIVSPQAGTTRDTIEEVLHIHGLPFLLVDTAGLRQHTSDSIELTGMARTQREIERADVILEVVDGTLPPAEVHRVAAAEGRKGALLIFNKLDCGLHPEWAGISGIPLSATTGEGVETLRLAMRDAVWQGAVQGQDQLLAINARHQACFIRARTALGKTAEGMRRQDSPEFVALELREALEAVGEVMGRVDVEELLGSIFSQFCIGK